MNLGVPRQATVPEAPLSQAGLTSQDRWVSPKAAASPSTCPLSCPSLARSLTPLSCCDLSLAQSHDPAPADSPRPSSGITFSAGESALSHTDLGQIPALLRPGQVPSGGCLLTCTMGLWKQINRKIKHVRARPGRTWLRAGCYKSEHPRCSGRAGRRREVSRSFGHQASLPVCWYQGLEA